MIARDGMMTVLLVMATMMMMEQWTRVEWLLHASAAVDSAQLKEAMKVKRMRLPN